MATLAQQAELLKLARLLRTTPERLGFLAKLDVMALRALRAHVTATLFDADRDLFQRLAAASKLLPAAVTALIAEKALGPLLCARIAGLLPAQRAADIATRLDDRFLADVCIELDPRQVRALIADVPVNRVVAVALELARRREYITMARFVDCLPQPALRGIIEALRDDTVLLRIGFFVEDPAALGAVIDLLPATRLRNMIVAALDDDAALWAEALALINAIPAEQRRRVASIAAALDDAHLAHLIERTQAQDLWEWLLPIVAEMDAAHHDRLAHVPALADDGVLEALILAADRKGLYPQLLPLVARMDAAVQTRAARVAERLGPAVVQHLNQALRGVAATA